MRLQFIILERFGKKNLYLVGRDISTGDKYSFRIYDFVPYFYVPGGNDGISIDGELLRKIVVDSPRDVPIEREKYSRHFEADIVYVLRAKVDMGIKSGFSVPDKRSGGKSISWKEIKGW